MWQQCAQAVAEVAAPLERVAEDTRPVNSLSYLPMSKLTKERWSEADTDKFYYALQTVGCDFTMIAKFFDGRTRKQVCLRPHAPLPADSLLATRPRCSVRYKHTSSTLTASLGLEVRVQSTHGRAVATRCR